LGVAVKEYLTYVGPADYVLFIDGKPCGVIEAKKEEEAHRLNMHEVGKPEAMTTLGRTKLTIPSRS
jgi:type I site-specific restriction endonuclease